MDSLYSASLQKPIIDLRVLLERWNGFSYDSQELYVDESEFFLSHNAGESDCAMSDPSRGNCPYF